MTAMTASPAAVTLVARAVALLDALPKSLALAAVRLALAVPFFYSGLTKWDGFLALSDSAVLLFTEEFRLNLFGGQYPLPAPALAAWLAGAGEIVLPVLLVFGLATRFAALGLLAMTAVIQLVYPEAWHTFHLPWAALALVLVTHGGGALGLDALIARRVGR